MRTSGGILLLEPTDPLDRTRQLVLNERCFAEVLEDGRLFYLVLYKHNGIPVRRDTCYTIHSSLRKLEGGFYIVVPLCGYTAASTSLTLT